MATRIRLRRGSAAAWTSANPTLLEGEIGVETDTVKLKVGDGTTAWNDLDYFTVAVDAGDLADLADVDIDGTPADNELLAYDAGSGDWINQTPAEAGVAAASHQHAAGDVNSGTFDDARIAESNVTQHEAALTVTEAQVSDLGDYATNGDLTSHTGDTGNPHSVTAAQADALPEDAVINAQNSNYELQASDAGRVIEATGEITITLPDGLDTGFQCTIVNVGSDTVTLSAATTLQSAGSAVTLATQYEGCVVYHRGGNVWLALGGLE